MSKRTLTAVVILALIAGGVIGGLAGFTWHAPGHATTWDDIRNWATALAVIIGVPVALYQLYLQRRQLASQQGVIEGEVDRNKRRDELLDGQLRELQQRAQLARREQAEAIGLSWEREGSDSFAEVVNDSRRPIRDVVCHIDPGPARPPAPAGRAGEMVLVTLEGGISGWTVQPGGMTDTNRVPVLGGGGRAGFAFNSVQPEQDSSRVIARFTDDAGLHWELDNYLHLEQVAERDDL